MLLAYTTNPKSPNCETTIKLDKSSRLLSGRSGGLILRSVLTWAVSHFFSDHLRLLLIQRCDARFRFFGMTTRSRFFRVTLRA